MSEVDFTFASRYSGESKAGFHEGCRFLYHLLKLRVSTLTNPRIRRAIAFGLVGATGIIVNTMALWLFSSVGHINYLVGAALATQVSTTANFIGNEVFVFRGDKRGTLLSRFVPFAVMNNVVMLARLPLLSLLVTRFGIPTLIANVMTLLVVFVVRFGISDRFIYSSGSNMQNKPTSERQRIGPVNVTTAERRHLRRSKHNQAGGADVGPFRHTYDVHGILTVGSDGELPELEFFRVEPTALPERDSRHRDPQRQGRTASLAGSPHARTR